MSRPRSTTERLLIVQPYVPSYRVPFFELLKEDLSNRGIDCAVAAATAQASDHLRGDDRSGSFADFQLPERRIRLGSRSLAWRELAGVITTFQPSMVIVEQAIKNLEAWRLLLPGLRTDMRVGMWGHGRTFTTDQSWLSGSAKRWLTGRADWFFAYTEEGAKYVEDHGFPRARVSVIQNATDSHQLRNDLANVDESKLRNFEAGHGLVRGNTGIFLGGVDERKGIPFLLDAVERIGQVLPDFKLVVVGAGSLSEEVVRCQKEGAPIVYLGRLEGQELSLALASADVMLVPEWVGLVAVDSLAAGLPLVTTTHPSHAPEFAYLREGETALVVKHDPQTYADAVVHLLQDHDRLMQMQERAAASGKSLTIQEMARRFSEGVVRWSRSGSR